MIAVAGAAAVVALCLFAATALRERSVQEPEIMAPLSPEVMVSTEGHEVKEPAELKPQEPSQDTAVKHHKPSVPKEQEKPGPKVKKEPDPVYLPPLGERPILAILIDDGGYSMETAKSLASLGMPMTWAIIPYTPHAKETAQYAASKNIPYIVHMPMQAVSDKSGGEYIIGKGMASDAVKKKTEEAIASLPGAVGMNNHRGSLATSDKGAMAPLMEVLKAHNMIFVDSRTHAKSVAYDVAVQNGVKALKNNCFIDGTADVSAMQKRFDEAARTAEKRGSAVAICHFRPATLKFLTGLAKKKDSLSVRLVTIPEMVGLVNT
jgi:polysaccharide deacetylase 2 family uncharacterized protein YibQ